MSISSPKGYLYSVVEAAIKKPGRKDMALICSQADAVASGVFTTNAVKAAPVLIDMKKIRLGRGRAILVNSGNANACTGRQGVADAMSMSKMTADLLRLKPSTVYVCSTGVIGAPMPMDRITGKIPELVSGLGSCSIEDIASAIMTTDTFAKATSRTVAINGVDVTITGICKGAGMINPNMATMLCFILTDASVSKRAMDRALRDAVSRSFNMITIDGDMSTNDTVIALANGLAENSPTIDIRDDHFGLFGLFSSVLYEICLDLAKMIVRDGEGASKFMTIKVKNARNTRDAEKAAFSVANSMLVKTAIYGNDANWGRIMAAIGYSGASVNTERTDISINGVPVVCNGLSAGRDAEAQALMAGSKEVEIVIDLGLGRAGCRVFTCDLTEGYVRINAEYRT